MKEEVAPGMQPSLALTSLALTPSLHPAMQDAGKDDVLLEEPGHSLLLHVGGLGLDCLLESLCSALKKEYGEKSESIPSKDFMRKCKAHICIGVNDVTRTLERMPRTCVGSLVKGEGDKEVQGHVRSARNPKGAKTIILQAVLVAADVHPRLLASHLPGLAATRKVPCISISGGNGTGSMRLGEILNLRTAITMGVKVGDSGVNKAIECFLKDKCGQELGIM